MLGEKDVQIFFKVFGFDLLKRYLLLLIFIKFIDVLKLIIIVEILRFYNTVTFTHLRIFIFMSYDAELMKEKCTWL